MKAQPEVWALGAGYFTSLERKKLHVSTNDCIKQKKETNCNMSQRGKTYLPAIIIVLIAAAILIYQSMTGKQIPDDLRQKCRKRQRTARN
ncbi:hypothetical protein GCM10020331_001110 [Ectobacillus funiculus]